MSRVVASGALRLRLRLRAVLLLLVLPLCSLLALVRASGAPNDASLAQLSFSLGNLSPPFVPGTTWSMAE